MRATVNRSVLVRFGGVVKQLRHRMGISQEELAGRAGLHRTYIADIERGARNLSLANIDRLAAALATPVSVLFQQSPTGELQKPSSGGTDATADCGCGMEILLVEDDARDVEMTQRAFDRARITNRLRVVRDGAEALDWLLKDSTNGGIRTSALPGLILLDLNLPKVNGLEVLRQLKAHGPTREIPVVVLTVSQRSMDMLTCQELGATNYLVKPVGFQNFSQITPQLSLSWRLLGPMAANLCRT